MTLDDKLRCMRPPANIMLALGENGAPVCVPGIIFEIASDMPVMITDEQRIGLILAARAGFEALIWLDDIRIRSKTP